MFSARLLLAVSALAIVAVVPITAATLAKQIPSQSSFGDERYVDHIAGALAMVGVVQWRAAKPVVEPTSEPPA